MQKDRTHNRTFLSRFFPATAHVSQVIRLSLLMLIAISALVFIPHQQAQSSCDRVITKGCNFNKPTKLVLLLDCSGSMAPRGQTYNAQIDGAFRSQRP